MKHSEFKIGTEFRSGSGRRWRCTDVGSRTIVAIDIGLYPTDPSWLNGPPYAIAEEVFDEEDMKNCEPVE